MKSGQVAYLVIRPYDFVGFSYAQGAGKALAAIALAGGVQFFLQLAIAMTAFCVEENAAFFWIFQKLVLVVGTLMPLEFLPQAAQRAAWWSPFPAMSYAPARLASVWEGGAVCRAIYGLARSRLTVNGG